MKKTAQGYVVGVDLGGTKILSAVIDRQYEIVSKTKKNTRAERGAKVVTERIATCIEEALDEAGLSRSDIRAIGIGAQGMCDPATGKVLFAPNLDWHNQPLGAQLSKSFGVPVCVENDVNVSTIGVYERELRKMENPPANVVGIFIGTGIGGGIILNGKLHHGRNFTAGEIGHMILSDDGPKCGCGNKGCLEAFAGRLALVRRVANLVKKGKDTQLRRMLAADKADRIKSRHIAEALNQRDPIVRKLVDNAAEHIGIAVANVIHLLCPDVIVLGGGVMQSFGNYMFPRIRRKVRAHAISVCARGVRIVGTDLGDDAGIIGSAVMAWQRVEALEGTANAK